MSLDSIIREIAREEASAVLCELTARVDIFPTLPEISTTGELADALRVSEDVLRRMCEGGMPHTHAGREFRFSKILVIEWTKTGKLFSCDICLHKTSRLSTKSQIDEALRPEDGLANTALKDKTSKKLSRLIE